MSISNYNSTTISLSAVLKTDLSFAAAYNIPARWHSFLSSVGAVRSLISIVSPGDLIVPSFNRMLAEIHPSAHTLATLPTNFPLLSKKDGEGLPNC
jgi:hypothetical protein